MDFERFKKDFFRVDFHFEINEKNIFIFERLLDTKKGKFGEEKLFGKKRR